MINTKLVDGRLKLGELTGGKMDDITVLVAMVEEAQITVPVSSEQQDDLASAVTAAAVAADHGNVTAAKPVEVPTTSAAATESSSISRSANVPSASGTSPAVAGVTALQSSRDSRLSDTTSSSSGAGAAAVKDNSGPNMLVAGTAVVFGATMLVAQFFA